MPIWRTTHNILKAPWEGDVFDENWMNYNTIQTPPYKEWDYKRELKLEDVSVWEVIHEGSGFIGVYAAWDPYAEFYLVTTGCCKMETFYGKGAQKRLKEYLKEHGIKLNKNEVWVEAEDMWLYE
jgi:hypothetical protein